MTRWSSVQSRHACALHVASCKQQQQQASAACKYSCWHEGPCSQRGAAWLLRYGADCGAQLSMLITELHSYVEGCQPCLERYFVVGALCLHSTAALRKQCEQHGMLYMLSVAATP
jgi:hypothetical protein